MQDSPYDPPSEYEPQPERKSHSYWRCDCQNECQEHGFHEDARELCKIDVEKPVRFSAIK